MADRSIHTPCIIFALARESKFFRREFRPRQRFPGSPCWARFCGAPSHTTLVIHSGMGHIAAKRAINWVLSKPILGEGVYLPTVVIMAGFGGALIEGLRVGDVVLASEVGNHDGTFCPVTWPHKWPETRWKTAFHQGKIVTVDKMICSSKKKKELGRISNALAVDMESAYVAHSCAERGVAFGCIRAISDAVDKEISVHLSKAFSNNRVSLIRLTDALIRSPTTILELVRLARHSQIAARNLRAALCELLLRTPARFTSQQDPKAML
jgi:adenosylhomocysteine nucleosidase